MIVEVVRFVSFHEPEDECDDRRDDGASDGDVEEDGQVHGHCPVFV